MGEQTVACRICGRPYVFYAFCAGDQSACPACRAEARGYGKVVITTTDGAAPKSDPADDAINRLIRDCGGKPPKTAGEEEKGDAHN